MTKRNTAILATEASGPLSASAPPALGAAKTSKLDTLVALLGTSGGTTIAELMLATGWQQHSVRGAMAGALRKRGHAVVSDKLEGVRRYRIAAAADEASAA